MGNSIQITEHIVVDGHEGWKHGRITYKLACGPTIAQVPNGDLLCAWLSGSGTEPATDNNVLMARSTDLGHTWSEPWIFVPAGKDAGALTALYSVGDTLIGLGAHWPSDKNYTIWRYFRQESQDNGHTWSDPEPMVIYDDQAAFGTPIVLNDGTYLYPGSVFLPREQPLRGPIEDLANAKSEEEALAIPSGEGGIPKPAEKFGTHLHGCFVLSSENGLRHDLTVQGLIANRPLGLLESTIVEASDGRTIMLMRAEWGGFLWRAESSDRGRTWTDAWETDIPNPTTKAALTKLPDGRIVLIHNAAGGVRGKSVERDPLSIWVSDDDMETWCIKEDVITGGALAYPDPEVLSDGRLVFAYDHNRRQTRFVEVEIPAKS